MAHKIHVALSITGENFKHEDLSTLFELEPTSAWNINEIDNVSFQYRFSAWDYQSPLPDFAPLDHHIQWLMSKFRGKDFLFDKLPPESYVSLRCAIYIDVQDNTSSAGTPNMGLSREAIHWLSRINALYDNDSYLTNFPFNLSSEMSST